MNSVLRSILLPLALMATPVFSQSASDAAALQSAQADLQSAVKRIAMRPDDADALADAGAASLKLGDPHAALNFYTRASAARPNDGRIVAGLASATVRTENPFEALRLFDDALKLGVPERNIAADRALAFDLLGNFARAQQDYQMARLSGVTDDLIIHQAVSLSLLGKFNDADGMLVPLLQREVPEAWRARAFMLAARGDYREADKVAQGFLDADSAEKMDRYFRLMPDLTPAQKSAAIHFGHFPASYDIGHDSEAVRALAATIPAPAGAQGDARLIPSGKPLGPAKTDDKKSKDKRTATTAADKPVEVARVSAKKKDSKKTAALSTQTARDTVANADNAKVAILKTGELPKPDGRRPGSTVVPQPLPKQSPATILEQASGPATVPAVQVPAEREVKVAAAQPMQPSPDQQSATQSTEATPSLIGPAPLPDRALATTALPPAETSVAVAAPVDTASSEAENNFDLDNVVKSIELPPSEKQPSVAAVDLASIKSTKQIPSAKTEMKPVVGNPPRIWVQVATGAESALAYDYRAMTRKNPELFDGYGGWTSQWSKSSRLLVGPFDSLKDAKQWEADFRKAGGNGFVWQSGDGAVVTQVGGSTVKQASKPAAKEPARSTPTKAPAKTGSKQAAKQGSAKDSAKQASASKPAVTRGTTKGGSTKAVTNKAGSVKGGSKADTAKQAPAKTAKSTGATSKKTSDKTAKTPTKSTAKSPAKTTGKGQATSAAKTTTKSSAKQKKK